MRSKLGGNLRLRTDEPVKIEGVTANRAKGSNPNSFYHTVDAGKPIVASGAVIADVNVRPTITIDVATTAEGSYTILPSQ